MDKTTILYLHGSADLYGADRTLLQLVQGLDKDRFRAVVALPKSGPLLPELRQAGAIVVLGPLGVGCRASMTPSGIARLAWELPRSILFVRWLVKKYSVDLVHTNTIVVLGGALGAWLSRAAHVWHVHEIMPSGSKVTEFFVKALRWFSDKAVSNSRSTRSSFFGDTEQDHRVIHNGIAAPRRISREAARAKLGIDRRVPLVTIVGRINSWKGQELLVKAAADLRFRHPTARYRVVGDSPPGQPGFERDLDAMIDRLELRDIVTRVGFKEDATLEFRAADVVVVPSTRPEPFGLVAIEAMAQGAPVVGARHGGLTEVIVENETGLFFEPENVDDLANKISTLLTDYELAEELGRGGEKRQAQYFTVDRYCSEFERLYDEVRAA